ncbi:hypothetical protein J6590_044669 [Homalodisca vitripennis]|nr:hypothetical protein J6590_044669 [Homalodisca vitripennis]
MGLVIWGQPEREVSVGLHEPVGPCSVTRPVQTILGVLKKKEFLCAVDYDEAYFDFHCVHGGHPKGKAKWYTICGTPFDNRAEYITVVSTITLLALGIFWNIYFNTAKHQIHSLQETKSISTKKQKFQ